MLDMFKIPKESQGVRTKKNVLSRQKLKSKWDKHCKWSADEEYAAGSVYTIEELGVDTDNFVRLLDEGVVVEGDGSPYAVIAKGTLKKWFDGVSSDYEGYINKDHISGIDLGTFSKNDLKLVELDDGRYGIDVNVKLDHELYATKDLLKQMNRKALSAEFYFDADEYVKASAVTGENFSDAFVIPKISEVSIVGYAVVDNPKNANSYNDNLLEKASNEERNEMTEEFEAPQAPVEAPEEVVEEVVEAPAEEAVEEVVEEVAEEVVEAPEEAEKDEEAIDEDVAEDDGQGLEPEFVEEPDKVEASIEKISDQLASFKAELASKDAEIADLKAKLSAQKLEKESFENKLASLLNFATADEPTVAEGAETTTEENKDDYATALENAFKGM